MARIEPKQREIALVLIGRFNPAIVQPGWLAKYGIVGENEAKAAKVQLVNPDLTVLRFDLFEVVVQSENFTIKTHDIHPEIIRDFVLKTFGEFLFHTPIRMMGINYQVVLECPSVEARDRFGRRLAPREPWGKWGEMLEGDSNLESTEHGGLVSITMKQSKRPDGLKGYVNTRLDGVPGSKSSVTVMVNDHFDVTDGGQDASAAISILEKRWEDSLKFSEFIISEVSQQILAES